ncbi:MAG: PQQ-binding-like beta-propeller repeat protein [Blastocatellia bacterium]
MNSHRPFKPLRRAIRYGGLIVVASLSSLPVSRTEPRYASDTAPTVAMVVQTGAAMNYWPHWRGPSVQGIVEGKGYPDRWSETENILWKVQVPGRGHSSPIVWGDRIFLSTAAADGSRRSMLSFRRSDGKLLWETVVPEAPAERLYQKNSYASSSPTTDGELVYGYFGSSGVVAVNFSGKLVWHVSLGAINLYHGPGGSPVLYKDRLILFQDQMTLGRDGGGAPPPGFIVALDKKTGRELWRKNRSPRPGWGSPIAVQVGDHVEIIVSSGRAIDAYDPYTGELLWTVKGNMPETIPMPVVGHGLLYCSSGRAGPTFAIRPGGKGDVTASHVAWSSPKGSPFVPSPLVFGDYLYTINDMVSIASCHNARTGEIVGQLRLGELRREGFSASPVVVEGKVYFTNDDGETFVLSPAPDFKMLHVNRLGEPMLASPALVDGRWYFRTAGHLLCVGKKS